MIRGTWISFAVGLVAVATGTAHAAPPWSESRPVGGPEPGVADATIAYGSNGAALLSRRTTRAAGQSTVGTDRLTTLTADGRLVEDGSLSDHLAAPPQVFGKGRVALLRRTSLSKPRVSRRASG